jgi:hypothetical protein
MFWMMPLLMAASVTSATSIIQISRAFSMCAANETGDLSQAVTGPLRIFAKRATIYSF